MNRREFDGLSGEEKIAFHYGGGTIDVTPEELAAYRSRANLALGRTAETINGKQSLTTEEVGALLEILQAIRRSLERMEKIAEAQLRCNLKRSGGHLLPTVAIGEGISE